MTLKYKQKRFIPILLAVLAGALLVSQFVFFPTINRQDLLNSTVSIGATVVHTAPPAPKITNTQNNSISSDTSSSAAPLWAPMITFKKPFTPITEPFSPVTKPETPKIQDEEVFLLPPEAVGRIAPQETKPIQKIIKPTVVQQAIITKPSLTSQNVAPKASLPSGKIRLQSQALAKTAVNIGKKVTHAVRNVKKPSLAFYNSVSATFSTTAARTAPAAVFRLVTKVFQLFIGK
jgi:hypothetical protein